MTNPHRGEVSFKTKDGTEYKLRYSIDALVKLEEGSGRTILQLMKDLNKPDGMSIKLARLVIWCGLVEDQPSITLKEAGELIPEAGGMTKLAELFNEAFVRAFPQPEEGDENPPPAGGQKNGTGLPSSESGVASDATKTPSGDRPQDKSS